MCIVVITNFAFSTQNVYSLRLAIKTFIFLSKTLRLTIRMCILATQNVAFGTQTVSLGSKTLNLVFRMCISNVNQNVYSCDEICLVLTYQIINSNGVGSQVLTTFERPFPYILDKHNSF